MNTKNLKTGTVVKSQFSKKKYLIISHPVVVRAIQKLIKAVPISDKESCKKGKHMTMPRQAKTQGVICMHEQDTLNCEQLEFVERLDKDLANSVIQKIN